MMGLLGKLFGGKRTQSAKKPIQLTVEELEKQEKACFEALYRRSFPDYQLMTDIPARTIYPATRRNDAMPVTFLLSQNGLSKLAVLIMEPNEYGCENTRATERACQAVGLPYIRFFFGWRNDPDYVVSRTRKCLS